MGNRLAAHIFSFCIALGVLALSCPAWSYTVEDCVRCHGREGEGSDLNISIDGYHQSIHGEELACQECHVDVEDDGHQETPGSGAVDCAACHEKENRHAVGASKNRPACYSCHTKHDIRSPVDPDAAVHPDRLKDTCKACHPRECGETDYLSRLPSWQIASHGKQDFSKRYENDNCLGCHQGRAAHGEEERISEDDCHRCHRSENGERLMLGYIHPKADPEENPGIFAASVIYHLAIVALFWAGIRAVLRKWAKREGKGRSEQ